MAVARYGPRLSRQGRRTGPGLSLFTTDPNEKDYVRVLRERPMGLLQTQQSSVYMTALPEAPTSELQLQIKVKDHEETTCFNSMETQLDLTSEPKRSVGTKATTTQIGPCTMQVDIGVTTHIVKYPYPTHGTEVKVNVDKKAQRVYLTAPFLNPVESGGYPVDPFPLLRHANYSPWNIHHVFLDRMPKLSTRNPTNFRWLVDHTAVQMSDRERFVQHCTQPSKRHPSDVLVNIKESLATLIKLYAGLQQASQTIFGLREPSSGIYLVICVGGLRLDLAAATVVLDTAVIPWSPETAKLLDSKISINEVETQPGDVAAWKGLIAASVERCRTWSHGPNCEYRSTGDAPIPTRVEDSPLCSCGRGRGFESLDWKVPTWERLLPHSTRAAISPLFGVSYVESIIGPGMKLQNTKRPVSWEEPTNKCWLCERSGRMPIPCPRCKKAKYCSRDCQRKHKELEHKHVCRP
ncbi:hypothetical protein FRC09_006525 [Ceratobasidium sp. 395]|nr:hypothetical protein FRC09_006525 [Ceratobasidium sp. 395]